MSALEMSDKVLYKSTDTLYYYFTAQL